jgi:hypothetical protein
MSDKLIINAEYNPDEVRIKEFDSDVSVNGNTQLKVTPFTDSGTEGVLSVPFTDFAGEGDLTVGVTQVEVTFTGVTKEIRIRADIANTGIIFIGKIGVLSNKTNDFVRLHAGDEVILDYNDATNALYAISDTAAQTINRGALL